MNVRGNGLFTARGDAPGFLRGTAILERHAFVVTSSRDQIDNQERRTPQVARYRELITFAGSAVVRVPNPVEVFFRPGPFVLGGSGSAQIHVPSVGTFSRFVVATGVTANWFDPLGQGYLRANAGGTAGTAAWSRSSVTVVPPARAVFAVPDWGLEAVPAGGSALFDAHQYEIGSSPTGYSDPRSITPVVHATRVNLVTETASSTATATNTKSFAVNGLVPGNVYTASAQVSVARTLSSTGIDVLTRRDDDRAVLVFKATAETETFQIAGGSTSWSYRRILVEAGDRHLPWFDGDSGVDYLWEDGKTAGTDARSFYYPKRSERHSLLRQTVEQHAALGIAVNAPRYGVFTNPM